MSRMSDLHFQLTSLASDPSEDSYDRAAAARRLREAGWDFHPTASDFPRRSHRHEQEEAVTAPA